MPEDNVTKDGIEKQKTGPKVGSHHPRGRAIAHATAGKAAIVKLANRLDDVEKEVGLAQGGVLDPKTYDGGEVPAKFRLQAREQLTTRIKKKGAYFPLKNGQYVQLSYLTGEGVLIADRELVTDRSHCKEMKFHEFYELVGLRFNG